MCYIKMFYLQMKQVKKEIIRNSRSMTMPNLYVDHQKSKLKLIKMFCVDCRGHVLNILPSENAWFAMYSMYSTNQMYIEQNLHILIFQKEILFLYIHNHKCVDGRYILQQAKTLSYCVSLAINVKKSNNTRGSYWKSDI